MVFNQTQNPSIKNNLIDELRLNPSVDVIPSVVNPSIQPVFEVYNKVCDIVRSNQSTSTGTITAFTTPSDKDFYLTGITAAYIKDATCDTATGRYTCNATVAGTARELLGFPIITTTAQQDRGAMNYPTPIKVDRNTAITFTGSFTAGVLTRTICINGYTLDTAIKTV